METLYPRESHTRYYRQWFFTTDKNRIASVSIWSGNILACIQENVGGQEFALKVYEGKSPLVDRELEWEDVASILAKVDLEAEIASILSDFNNAQNKP